jgi:hypothetical protein
MVSLGMLNRLQLKVCIEARLCGVPSFDHQTFDLCGISWWSFPLLVGLWLLVSLISELVLESLPLPNPAGLK